MLRPFDRRRRSMTLLAAALAALAATAQAQVTPEQSCEAGKTDATGKYAACVSKAEKTFVLKGDSDNLAGALAKCAAKFGSTWEKLEEKAVDKGTTCPSTGDEAAVQAFLDACAESVATAVGGSPLPLDPVTCNANLETCEDDLEACGSGGAVLTTSQTTCYDGAHAPVACAGTGQDGESQTGLARSFTDNGDGTVTDDVTGLMWEKKSDDNSIHDKDIFGLWPYAGKFVQVLNGNAAGCSGAGDPSSCCTGAGTGSCSPFAGYTDWRL
ncbi:MAG TPA: hypothetical protein VEL28_09955, partial [Candidatus Binatia bacterium]|nr:hypothetical protein [Candidatus Binatia bacterium]